MAAIERFDCSMAAAWRQRFDLELESVKALLLKISEVSRSGEGSDDTVWRALDSIGADEQTAMEKTVRMLTELSELTGEVIREYELYGEEARECVHSLIERHL